MSAFKAKAIETHFDGWRFRSRLEARHAVLMKHLGIKYAYEHEGYVLEGVTYLPDFWLPDLDCFVEIKGQEPTDEERRKTRLLALYTQKDVHTFYGPIEIPNLSEPYSSTFDRPPQLWTYPKSEGLGKKSTNRVEVSSDILALLQLLDNNHMKIRVDRWGDLDISSDERTYGVDDIDIFIMQLEAQRDLLQRLQRDIVEKKDELHAVLTPPQPEWLFEFFVQDDVTDGILWWNECDTCGAFDITADGVFHECGEGQRGNFVPDTPKLREAIAAAKSARFEHGEKG